MAEVLTGLTDHIIKLMQGDSSLAIDRPIESGTFKHTKFLSEKAVLMQAGKPYPFSLVFEGGQEPSDIRGTTGGSQRGNEANITMTVGYTVDPQEQYTRQKTIVGDYYSIRRTLTDHHSSWDGVTGYEGCFIDDWSLEVIDAEQGKFDIQLLVIPLRLLYWEDHTS